MFPPRCRLDTDRAQCARRDQIYRMGAVEVSCTASIWICTRCELLVMLGVSGSSKSTLLNIFCGLDVPTSGEVRYLDHSLTRATEEELTRFRREHVGFFSSSTISFPASPRWKTSPWLPRSPCGRWIPPPRSSSSDSASGVTIFLRNSRAASSSAWRSCGAWPSVRPVRRAHRRARLRHRQDRAGADRPRDRELGATTVVITHNAAVAAMANRVVRMSSGRIVEETRNFNPVSPSELSW